MALAIFDLDNTLIAGDSDHAWGEFLVSKNLVDIEHYRRNNEQFYDDYKTGNLVIEDYLAFCLAPLKEHSMQQLTQLHNEFLETCIKPIMLPKARDLLEKHRQAGDYLLIITATNDFITKPIANLLQVDDIIATTCEVENGQYTGKHIGVPSFQEGKITRLKHWLEHNQLSIEGSYFYSDSHNDLPLLQLVDFPVAVDPDDTLQALAEQQQWPIMSLRS